MKTVSFSYLEEYDTAFLLLFLQFPYDFQKSYNTMWYNNVTRIYHTLQRLLKSMQIHLLLKALLCKAHQLFLFHSSCSFFLKVCCFERELSNPIINNFLHIANDYVQLALPFFLPVILFLHDTVEYREHIFSCLPSWCWHFHNALRFPFRKFGEIYELPFKCLSS